VIHESLYLQNTPNLCVVCPAVKHNTISLLRSDVRFSDIGNSKYMVGLSLVYF